MNAFFCSWMIGMICILIDWWLFSSGNWNVALVNFKIFEVTGNEILKETIPTMWLI